MTDILNERAVSAAEIAEYRHVGLVKTTRTLNGIKRCTLVVCDFESTLTLGMFTGYSHSSDTEWHQDEVYAVPGYGPLLHEMFLCAISPSWLIPSRTIRPKAVRIWGLFQTLHGDVSSKPLPVDHEYFADEVEYEVGHPSSDPQVLKAVNAMYRMNLGSRIFNTYNELGMRGLELMEKSGVSAGKVIRDAYSQFSKKYKSETITESFALSEGWSLPEIDRQYATSLLFMRLRTEDDE